MEQKMIRLVIAAVVATVLAGCASQQQKAPECQGAYTPVNSRDKYPDLVEKDLQERASTKGAHKK